MRGALAHRSILPQFVPFRLSILVAEYIPAHPLGGTRPTFSLVRNGIWDQVSETFHGGVMRLGKKKVYPDH